MDMNSIFLSRIWIPTRSSTSSELCFKNSIGAILSTSLMMDRNFTIFRKSFELMRLPAQRAQENMSAKTNVRRPPHKIHSVTFRGYNSASLIDRLGAVAEIFDALTCAVNRNLDVLTGENQR